MLTEIEARCRQWLCPVNGKNADLNNNIQKLYHQVTDLDFTSPINAFTSRLAQVEYEFEKTEQVSGSICFYGGVLTSLLTTGKVEQVEDLFTFALCYMLIDHFLDSKEISKAEKDIAMKELYNFLVNDVESDNILIRSGGPRYQKMIQRDPAIKKEIIKLLQSELVGTKLTPDDTRDDILANTLEKGGMTAQVIATIIGLDTSQNGHYDLGSCIQLVDDLIDLKDDQDLGIWTLALHDWASGCLDQYIWFTFQKIHSLPNCYNFFKIILFMGCILGIHDNGRVSEPLRKILDQYNIFDQETSKDSLNNWFHSKLYNYIEERNNK